ncbi:hypothetical protein [Streptomyces sp. CC210A]|uniref:hypothetical protein n=1 Tax=Streptomyces sp. CC210A TaxID=2898184 RepID=UPI001F42D616|nr:hypothetical protein [Streptomyces sp. CC210A]
MQRHRHVLPRRLLLQPPRTVTATTTGFTPTCDTASTYDHTRAGRAYQSGGYAYSGGSDELTGLWHTFTVRTLRQTAPGHVVVSEPGCPA